MELVHEPGLLGQLIGELAGWVSGGVMGLVIGLAIGFAIALVMGRMIGPVIGLDRGQASRSCRRIGSAWPQAPQIASQAVDDLPGHGHEGLQSCCQDLALAALQGLERELQANIGLHHTVMQIESKALAFALTGLFAELLKLPDALERGVGQMRNPLKHAPLSLTPYAPAAKLQVRLTLLPGQGHADALKRIGLLWRLVQPHSSIARALFGQVEVAVAGAKKLLCELQHAIGTVLKTKMGIEAAQQLANQFKLAALGLQLMGLPGDGCAGQEQTH
jgi:hypothetical protein